MRRHLGVMLIAGMWAAWGAIPGTAQSKPKPASNPAPCSVAPQPEPCGTTPAPAGKASAAEKFPFPGSSTPDTAVPSISGVPATPDAPPGSTSSPAAKSFPFPGDASKPGSGGSSSSSSSSSSGDNGIPIDPGADSTPGAAPGLKDEGSQGTAKTPGRHILHRVNPVGTKLQTDDEREQEDLDIAHFYVQSGDLKGAYLRSQDAVKLAPDDADAHFALAEIALKLNKRDEAVAEYNACLKFDPTEKQAKEARKALARLKP